MERLQQLFSELKRRRVFRALLAWGIFAIAALQVAEPLIHALDLKQWALKLVVVVLAAGFPVTAILSWLYDLTSKGVRRTLPVDTEMEATIERPVGPRPGSPAGMPPAVPGQGDDRPGPLSILIQELAQAPGDALLAAWKDEPRPGDRVGRFEIRKEIGRGGFGAVYEARDGELGRLVALKALRPRRTGTELSADWIKKEAEAVARLDHPCIVTLFDVGTSEGGPYLVMELLRGETLAQRLESGPLSTDQALQVARQMARGLAHAHKRGILHRDLKPANVFLCEDGRVKLLDFGLAHLLGSAGPAGSGTPGYMPPEQARGDEIDPRADVYAAAMTLREMVTGKHGPASDASMPGAIARTLEKALSQNREDRPRDGTAWLETIVAARAAVDRPRRMRRIAAMAIAVVLVGLGVAAIVIWRWSGSQFLAEADGRVSVAVADFANQTGDADLDGLSGMLITSLEQSKKLRVMTRSRMWDHLRAMGRDRAERIDEPLAREIGKRSGARALLLASIRRLDDVYAVEMRAFDPNRDEYLFTVREQTSGKKGVLELIDRLSERTRIELREARTDVAASGFKVAEATTSSLEAYEHYFRGEQFAAAEKPTEALDAYQRAVKIDPGFAQAHLAIATLLRVVDPEQSSKALGEALLNANRLPDKERLLLRAQEAGLGYRTEEALGLLERVRERWPEDPDGYWLAGQLLIGQRGDFDRGLPFLDRAVALDAGRFQALIRAQILGARLDDALKSALDFARQRPGPASLGLLTIVYSARGEVGHALEAARRAVQAGAAPTLHLLHAYIRAGAVAEAEALVRSRMTPDTPGLERREAFIDLAVLQGVQGRMHEGRRTLDGAARDVDGGKPSPQLWWARAFFLGGTGDADAIYAAARAQVRGGFGGQACNAVLLADLGQAWRAEELLRGFAETPCASIVRAVGAFREGQREEALLAMERLRFPLARYYQGKALVAVGRDAEAITALRAFQNQMTAWLPFFAWAYPESLYLSAVAMERSGDVELARQELDRLLGLWSGADPDLPLLAEAKALQARLAAAPAAKQ